VPELLFAPEVALGRLNRDVPEEELDLIQFAACEVAQPGTGSSQIVLASLDHRKIAAIYCLVDPPSHGFAPL
jgi:hypothetical protein